MLGVVAHDVPDYVAADERYRESLALYVELGDTRGVANVLNNMGAIAWRSGQWEEARALLEEALEHARRAGDPGISVLALTNLGLVALHQGGARGAAERMTAALKLVREHRLLRHAASCLEVSAAVLASQQESARAARLYAAAEQQRLALGARTEPAWRQAHQPMLDAIARDLGAARLDQESAAGRTLGLAPAIEEAEQGIELVGAS
jgi:Tfp pilus assembly protein PilF